MHPLLKDVADHEAHHRWDQALRAMTKMLQLEPRNARYYLLAGQYLVNLGRIQEGISSFRRAIEIQPDKTAYMALCKYLIESNQPDEAIPILEKTIAEDPLDIEPTIALSHAYERSGQVDRAIEVVRRLLEKIPDSPRVIRGLALRLRTAGRVEEAIQVLQDGLKYGDNAEMRSSIAFFSNYVADLEESVVFQRHRDFGRALLPGPPGKVPKRLVGEKIKIGYIGADFRESAPGSFLPRLLEGHDRTRFKIHVYSDHLTQDSVTKRVEKAVDVFRTTATMDHAKCAQVLEADELDVLVELAGLTTSSRLMILGYRVAPVQATYMAYCNTTGVPGVDLRFVDAWTDPDGADAYASESLIRLAGGFLCYTPPEKSPPVQIRPPESPFTFGCFNNSSKITPRWMEAVRRILERVPSARLLIKAYEFRSPASLEQIRRLAEECGLPMDRVELMPPPKDFRDHLKVYGQVDLALDTFPYNGTTTTCEGLWMGVPAVVFPGTVHRARVGFSLLQAAGLPQFVAENMSEWEDLAVDWAGRRDELANLRTSLRSHLESSALLDGRRMASALEQAYEAALDALPDP